MSRLIDADALWMDVIHSTDYCDDILEFIERQPTIESEIMDDLISRQAAIDSNNLIRKLPAMIQGRRKFAKIADGGDYHVGAVDDWCLTYKEVVQAIEDYCEYIDTGKFRLSAPINGNWNVLDAYPYKQGDAERRQDG